MGDVTQISVTAHQLSFRTDCNKTTTEVPSFTLRTALSAIPFVSAPCGADVQWFQEKFFTSFAGKPRNCQCKRLLVSSRVPNCKPLQKDLHNLCPIPKNCQLRWLLVSSRVPGNFCKLLWVSCEVLFSHGNAWIHWVARSCTTTAYRWWFRDSQIVA